MKISKIKIYYIIFAIGIISLTTVGSTYAYFAAMASSENVIDTSSSAYSISMIIEPIYHGFSLIPLNYDNTTKAINNKCHDKYNRGACLLYKTKVYDFNSNLKFISGHITAHTEINNLSYALLAPKIGIEDENLCTNITIENEESKEYCYYQEHTKFIKEEQQQLLNSYDVNNKDNVNLLLVIWLENENRSQNDDGIGTFSSSVTIETGNGGKIEGYINDAIEPSNNEG